MKTIKDVIDFLNTNEGCNISIGTLHYQGLYFTIFNISETAAEELRILFYEQHVHIHNDNDIDLDVYYKRDHLTLDLFTLLNERKIDPLKYSINLPFHIDRAISNIVLRLL